MSCNITSACDDYLLQMKADVRPGGQYAMYSGVEQNDVNVYTMEERDINVMRFYNMFGADNSEIFNFFLTQMIMAMRCLSVP